MLDPLSSYHIYSSCYQKEAMDFSEWMSIATLLHHACRTGRYCGANVSKRKYEYVAQCEQCYRLFVTDSQARCHECRGLIRERTRKELDWYSRNKERVRLYSRAYKARKKKERGG